MIRGSGDGDEFEPRSFTAANLYPSHPAMQGKPTPGGLRVVVGLQSSRCPGQRRPGRPAPDLSRAGRTVLYDRLMSDDSLRKGKPHRELGGGGLSKRDPGAAKRRSPLLMWSILVLLAYGLVELTAWAGLETLRIVGRSPEEPVPSLTLSQQHRERIRDWVENGGLYFTHSAALGWTVKPNGHAHVFRSNSRGIRADREYPEQPAPGKLRLASFGDSFTHGAEVELQDTWQYRLEQLAPDIEALNLGVDAYGPDQAYMRYLQDGPRLNPHIVIMGVMSENISRTVSVFRPFYVPSTGAPFVKPRFRIDGETLELIPNPFPRVEDYLALLDDTEATLARLGAHDHYYQVLLQRRNASRLPSLRLYRAISSRLPHRDPMQPGFDSDGSYDTRSEAYRITEKLMDSFQTAALQRGSLPIVLLYPQRADMERLDAGQARRYRPLTEHLQSRGYAWIDLLDTLSEISPADRFQDGGHYAPAANAAVARAILAYMQSQGLDSVEGVKGRLDRAVGAVRGARAEPAAR